MNDFRFADLGRVHWPATAKVALARGLASGIVIMIFMALTNPVSGEQIGSLLSIPLMLTFGALPMGLFIHAVGRIAGMFIPLMGFAFNLFGSLIVCVGDPLVYLATRQFPDVLNVADFGFFNLTPLMFITHPE